MHNDEPKVSPTTLTVVEKLTATYIQPQSLFAFVDSRCPNDIIEKIRELYRTCEERSHPIPWRRDFSFHLNEIFRKVQIVRKGKVKGLLLEDDTTDITAIFKKQRPGKPPRTVLIEGDPGMGKSTYCQKLAYHWATEQRAWDNSFPKIKVLLLLRCREMKGDIWEAISDQILPAGMDERAKDCFFRFVREKQNEVLLVLDGLGEANPNSLEVISNLCEGRDVLNCYIVLLSHQEIGRKFRSCCDLLWEIKGFTKEDATEFIRKYFILINKEHLSKKLLEKIGLRSYPESGSADLCALTSSPLNTALLCLLCDDYEGALPESRAELYIEYVLCVLRRYETNCGKRSKCEDLLGVHKKSLWQLGSMAFQSLLKGESHIELSESDSDSIVLSKLGFISLQAKGEMRKRLMRYAFIHDSLQEFFSGLYLAWQVTNGDLDCDSVVTDQRYRNELYKTFSFMTGILASTNEEAAKCLVQSMARNINSASCQAGEVLFASRCLSECTRLAHLLGKQLNLSSLKVEEERMDDSTVVCFSKALAVTSSLTNLSLTSTGIENSGAASISQVLKDNSSLTDLNLQHNVIGAPGASSLAAALKGNISLTNLDLSWNSIGFSGAASLAEALEANSSLTKLNLSGNSIGIKGDASLAQTLKANSSLTHLDLSYNRIGASGTPFISRALSTNSCLTHLNLSYNEIGALSATLLSMSLDFKSSLIDLNLSWNKIGAVGATALSQALEVNSSLTHLNLTSNSIGDGGAVSLSHAVAVNSSLTHLDLSSNGIGNSGATSLAKALKDNFSSSMTDLVLKGNAIDHSVADTIYYLNTVTGCKVYLCLAGLMMTLVLFSSYLSY